MTILTSQIAMPNMYRTYEPESSRDSVSVIMRHAMEETVLAENVRIADIPPEPYPIDIAAC